MDFRVDTLTDSCWRHAGAGLQQVVEANATTSSRLANLDLKTDFATRLTRMSNLLGVVMHMVRIDSLSIEEQMRLEQIAELARDEIAQANQQLTALNAEEGSHTTLDPAELLQSVLKCFASRLDEENIDVVERVAVDNIDMDPLVLRSLVTAIIHYAIERLASSNSNHKSLEVDVTQPQDMVLFTIKAVGPVCATSPVVDETFRPSTSRVDRSLNRSIQLASELGGNLSVRSWPHGESTIQLEVPARRMAR